MSSDTYSQDRAGRVDKVEQVVGEKCVTRVYGLSTASDRNSVTYDSANRITSAGYVYDALGRTTKVPAVDTGNPVAGDLMATYHSRDLVDTISQGGRTTDYSDSAVAGWQLSDLSGDIVATIHSGAEGLSTTSEAGEYGVLADSESVGEQRYGWLGAKQRAADTPSGIVRMGARLYNPVTGRFLQVDPVHGGGCNAYEYACADPVDKTDLDGKWPCFSKKCALKWAAKKWKKFKKKGKRNKVRPCLRRWRLRGTDGRHRGWGGCAGGVIMYHARKKGW